MKNRAETLLGKILAASGIMLAIVSMWYIAVHETDAGIRNLFLALGILVIIVLGSQFGSIAKIFGLQKRQLH